MATVNLTRTHNQLHDVQVASAVVTTADLQVSADINELFTLPQGSLIMSAGFIVEEAYVPPGATTSTATVNLTQSVGGAAIATIVNAANLAAVGSKAVVAVPLTLAAQATLNITPTYSGAVNAPTAAGRYTVFVQFFDPSRVNGNLTNYSTTP